PGWLLPPLRPAPPVAGASPRLRQQLPTADPPDRKCQASRAPSAAPLSARLFNLSSRTLLGFGLRPHLDLRHKDRVTLLLACQPDFTTGELRKCGKALIRDLERFFSIREEYVLVADLDTAVWAVAFVQFGSMVCAALAVADFADPGLLCGEG